MSTDGETGGDTWFLDNLGDTQLRLQDMATTWSDLEVTTACPSGKPAEAIIAEATSTNAT